MKRTTFKMLLFFGLLFPLNNFAQEEVSTILIRVSNIENSEKAIKINTFLLKTKGVKISRTDFRQNLIYCWIDPSKITPQQIQEILLEFNIDNFCYVLGTDKNRFPIEELKTKCD